MHSGLIHQVLCVVNVNAGKGILAADESSGSMAKRLGEIGVVNSETQRHTFRSEIDFQVVFTLVFGICRHSW